jgi:cardiolipin synthase (CMP-forming)
MAETPIFNQIPRTSGTLWSLPNMLTYGRLAAVPALVLLYYLEGYVGRWLSLLIFIAASVTDYLDGYFARAWQQHSAIGRMLDPIADKLIVAVSLMLLVSDATIGGWSLLAAIVILTREISVSGLREFLAELRVSVPVTWLAKWKTTMQMVAIGFLLAGPAGDRLFPGIRIIGADIGIVTYIGLLLLWISALVTLYTGYDYFRAAVRHLMKEDS